jgi:hypothetical protein
MVLEDAWLFGIDEIKQGDEIECPICKQASHHLQWEAIDLECASCGAHAGLVCPRCARTFDHIYDSNLEFKVKASIG